MSSLDSFRVICTKYARFLLHAHTPIRLVAVWKCVNEVREREADLMHSYAIALCLPPPKLSWSLLPISFYWLYPNILLASPCLALMTNSNFLTNSN